MAHAAAIEGGPARALLGDLFRDHHDALLGYVRKRIGDAEEARDIVQDCYYEIARRPNAIIEQPRAYLYRIAYNALIARGKVRKARCANAHIALEQASEAEIAYDAPSPESVTHVRQELAMVQEAIAKLKPKYRAAFLMIRFGGRSYKEVAAHMDMSVKSIELYVREALIEIKAHVDACKDAAPA